MASAGWHWSKGRAAKPAVTSSEPEPITYTASGQGAMFKGGEDLPMFTGGAYGGQAFAGMEPSKIAGKTNPAAEWLKRYEANQRKAAVRTAWQR